MKILFVCKHNRFRSKVAEAFFNKLNKNKKIKAGSAGIFNGIPASSSVVNAGKELGIKISKSTRGLNEKMLKYYDIIIITANNVPKNIFDDGRRYRKVIVWKISDTSQDNYKQILSISKQIEAKVIDFIRRLK